MPKDINDLRRDRKAAADNMATLAAALMALEEATPAPQDGSPEAVAIDAKQAEYDNAANAFNALDAQVKRAEAVEAAKAASAAAETDAPPVPGASSVPAQAGNPDNAGVDIGLAMIGLAKARGNSEKAREILEAEGHSGVSASLSGLTDGAGGITIPRAQSTSLIQLLRPNVVVRRAGARTVPMPAGELRDARQTGGATASYGAELAATAVSAQTFDAVDKSFKKLTSLVPVSNSLLRHTSLDMARMVRDDLVRVMATREDLAFIRGDGTSNTPKGLLNWAAAANWESVAIAGTLSEVSTFLRNCVSRVEDADVPLMMPGWIMRASAKHFLAELRDANGQKVYPSIDATGTLMGFPIYTSSQIPNNLGVGTDESEIYFASFGHIIIGDSMQTTIAVSTEATYVDGSGDTQSAFQKDQTLFRAVAEHDLAPEHDVAISGGRVAAAWTGQ